jgi:hypothetical protein
MTTAGMTKAMMKTNARTPWSRPARRAKATKKNPWAEAITMKVMRKMKTKEETGEMIAVGS